MVPADAVTTSPTNESDHGGSTSTSAVEPPSLLTAEGSDATVTAESAHQEAAVAGADTDETTGSTPADDITVQQGPSLQPPSQRGHGGGRAFALLVAAAAAAAAAPIADAAPTAAGEAASSASLPLAGLLAAAATIAVAAQSYSRSSSPRTACGSADEAPAAPSVKRIQSQHDRWPSLPHSITSSCRMA